MPSLSGPNPMSLGEFGNYANAGGVNQAAQGATGLAGAIIGDPAARMRAQYLGAEAGRATGQSQVIQKTLKDTAEIQSLLSQPGAITDGPTLQRVGALMATNPDLAAKFGSTLSTMMAANHSTGGPVTTQQTDAFAGSSGAVPYGQTPTGYGAGLQTQRDVAGIGAGATLGAARTAADASMTNERTREAGLDRRTLVPVGPSDNSQPPTYAPAAAAGAQHLPAYQPTVATTIAGNQSAYRPTATPGGGTGLATNQDIATTGQTPAATTPAEVQARTLQEAFRPGGATSPSPISPDQRDDIVNAQVATLSGRPPPGSSSMADAAALDQQITTRIKAMNPVYVGGNEPSQQLLDPIRLQATWIHDHDPAVRGDWNAAITKAVANVTNGGVIQDVNVVAPGPSRTVLGPNAQIRWPQGMPVPTQYATPGAKPGVLPAPPQGGTPAPAPGPGPSASPLAQALSNSYGTDGSGQPFSGAAPAPGPGAPSASPLAQALSAQAATTQAPQPPRAPAPPAAGPQAPQAAPPQPRPGPSNQAAAIIAQARSAVARATSPQQIAAIRQRLMQMNINPAAAGL